MFKLVLDSLTLNSTGSVILGLALLITHFWNRRKRSGETDIAVIDGISESTFSILYRMRLLLLGLIVMIGGSGLIALNYQQRVDDYYLEVFYDACENVMSSVPQSEEERLALKTIEKDIPISFLSEQIASEIQRWYSSRNDLNEVFECEPLVIKLHKMYWRIEKFDTVQKLERVYNEFFINYYGESEFLDIVSQRKSDESQRDYRRWEENFIREQKLLEEQSDTSNSE